MLWDATPEAVYGLLCIPLEVGRQLLQEILDVLIDIYRQSKYSFLNVYST